MHSHSRSWSTDIMRFDAGVIRAPVAAILAAFASLFLVSCGTEPDPQPHTGTVQGTVTLVPADSMLAGLPLVLMDVEEMAVVAGPDTTDELGAFRMEDVPVGQYYPVPLFRQDLQFDRSTAAVEVRGGETHILELRAMSSVLWDAEGPVVTGVIREMDSGAPVPGVMLTVSGGWVSEFFRGVTVPWEGLTDLQGRFELRGVRELCNARGCTGETVNYMVSRAGYRARALRFPMPGRGRPDSVHVELELEPGGDRGVIEGRVVLAGEAAVGVPVALGWFRDGEYHGKAEMKAPLMGFATRTDDEGRYRFENLPSGHYSVNPGYLPDDGFFFWPMTQPESQFELLEAQRKVVGDLELGFLIEPIHPGPGMIIEVAAPVFRWTPVEGADNYRVSVAEGQLSGPARFTTTPEIALPNALPDGFYGRWNVEAMMEGQIIGGFDETHTFEVRLTGDEEGEQK